MSRNSGMERASMLVVDKKIGETLVAGYPRTYSLTDAFGNFTAVSESELESMTTDSYKNRLAGLKNYVQGIEVGLVVDITNAYRENLVSCPIKK